MLRRPALPILIGVVFAAAACATEEPVAQSTPEPTRISVATTLYPFAWLAAEIAPEADVARLAQDAVGDPHDVQLSPGEIQALRRADVVIHVGQVGYQPEVERALRDVDGIVVEAVAAVDPLPLAEDHTHDDDVDGRVDDGGDEDAVDPHLWQSPAAMAAVAHELAHAFGEADPEGRTVYDANAQRVADELEALDEEADAALTGCDHDDVVLSHAGYVYLLEPRGIHQDAVTGPGGHGEPAPRRISELARKIRSEQIPAVLAEPVEGRAAAEALAREADVPVVDVHPLGAVTDEEAERGYMALLRENIAAFARALGCGADGAGAE